MTASDEQAVATLCALIGDVLDVADVTADEDFFELGGTSLKAAVLVAQIQRRFDVRLNATDVYEAGTARALAARLAGQRPPDAAAPVFLIHWYPADLAREIRLRRPAVVLSYGSARGEGWPPPVGVESLAAHYVDRMRRIRPDGPYHLVGYSLGGVIVWEMARQLIEAGAQVGLLCLIDSVPPHVRRVPLDRRAVVANIAAASPGELARRFRDRSAAAWGRLEWVRRRRWRRADEPGRLDLIDHRMAEYRMRPLPGYGGPLLVVEIARSARRPAILTRTPPAASQAYRELGLMPPIHRVMALPGDHRDVVRAPLAGDVAAAIDDAISATAIVDAQGT